MSLTGRLKPAVTAGEMSWVRASWTYSAQEWARLARPPLSHTRPAWRTPTVLIGGGVAALAATVLAMFVLDAPAVDAARVVPINVSETFNAVTDFGRSSWFLVPIGLLLLLLAGLSARPMTHLSRAVMASAAVRVEFLFVAIAAPSLFTTIIKRLIGRARPRVGGETDPFLYMHFVWRPDYASLPSGHATTAFAAAVALGLLWPRLRVIVWVYALAIAVSRVVLLAHHPSDVIAGALVGIVGALLVRDWFAARRLGFAIEVSGEVQTLPGPSLARLKRVARGLLAP
jgi:membrane-associated phospholipid phosphatase